MVYNYMLIPQGNVMIQTVSGKFLNAETSVILRLNENNDHLEINSYFYIDYHTNQIKG